MLYKFILLTLFLISFNFNPSFADETGAKQEAEENAMFDMVDNIKKTVVFLGKPAGTVNYLMFMKIKEVDELKAKEFFNDLMDKGYLNEKGDILSKLKLWRADFKIELADSFIKYEKEIIEILKQQLKPQFYATGFLVKVQDIFHLITAKHVVLDIKTGELKDENLFVFFNSKEGAFNSRSIWSVKEKYKVDWIFHQNAGVDVALIPFGIDLSKDDIKVILDKDFYPSDKLLELYEVFFLSYQPGIIPEKRISPIIRKGMISIINEDETFYIDGFAFPGNSGSPVFLKFAPLAVDENMKPYFVNIRKNIGLKFLGIVGEYLPYQEVAVSTQTGRPRMVFEENTGLSKVWSANYINQIIESEIFQKQLKKIKEKIQKNEKPN